MAPLLNYSNAKTLSHEIQLSVTYMSAVQSIAPNSRLISWKENSTLGWSARSRVQHYTWGQ